MVPLAVVALWMGVYPKPFLAPLKAPVESLMARVERAKPPQTPHTAVVRSATPPAAAGQGEIK